MIYEDDGDVDKALQFGLIAAHLNPSDCEEWVKLADMSLDRDNVRQAIICYSKGKDPGVPGFETPVTAPVGNMSPHTLGGRYVAQEVGRVGW